MDYSEAHILANSKILPEINKKFLKIFPDIFLKSSTTDKDEYLKANGCMYKWYMATISAVQQLNFSPKYSQNFDQTITNDWSCVQKFYEDMQTTDDFLKFIIENVKID